MSKLKLGVAIGAIVALSTAAIVTAESAAAGKPGGGGGGGGKPSGGGASITLNQSDPHLGDVVTFTTSGGSSITVNCFQGGLGNLVYAARQPVGTSFHLASPDWQSGPATCVAYLYGRRLVAQTGFEAAGAR